MSQKQIDEVPDLTALSLLHVADYANGALVYVASAKQFYTLVTDSGVTADGTFVVDPADGSPSAGLPNARWVRTSQALDLLAVITPTVLAADANDYAPTGLQGASIMRMDASTTGIDISGIAAPTSGLSKLLTITHIGTTAANVLTFLHQSTNSVAANRFVLPSAASVVLTIGTTVTFFYDVTSTRWRLLSTSSPVFVDT